MTFEAYCAAIETRVSGEGGTYLVVESGDADGLAAKVQELMTTGYTPCGPVSHWSHEDVIYTYTPASVRIHTYCQPMVKVGACGAAPGYHGQ